MASKVFEEYLKTKREQMSSLKEEDLLSSINKNLEFIKRNFVDAKSSILGSISPIDVRMEPQESIVSKHIEEVVDYEGNKQLRKLNEKFLSLNDNIRRVLSLFTNQMPTNSKDDTYYKADKFVPTKGQQIKQYIIQNGENKDAMDDLFDMFGGGDEEKRRTRSRKKALNLGKVSTKKSIFDKVKSGFSGIKDKVLGSVANPGELLEKTSLLDNLREKGLGTKALKVLSGASLFLAAKDVFDTVTDDTNQDKAKSLAKIGTGLATAEAGAIGGATVGASIGSVVPVAGTAVGGAVGGILGGVGGYIVGSGLGEKVVDTGRWVGDKLNLSDNKAMMVPMAALASLWSQDARDTLKNEWQYSMLPELNKFGDSFNKGVKEFQKGTDNLVTKASVVFDSLGLNIKDWIFKASGTFDDFAKNIKQSSVYKNISNALSNTYNTLSQPNALSKGVDSLTQIITNDKQATLGSKAYDYIEKTKEQIQTIRSGASRYEAPDFKRGVNDFGLEKGRWTSAEQQAIQQQRLAGQTFKGGKGGISQDVKDKIVAAADKYGLDSKQLIAMAQMESGGNPYAVSQTGAAGIFQFTGGTAKQFGVDNRFDINQNIDAGARLWKSNSNYLTKALGRAPTPQEIYLAHQQGAAGAADIIKVAEGNKSNVSNSILQNMKVNIGGNIIKSGDQVDAKRFIEENSKVFNANYAKVLPTDTTKFVKSDSQPPSLQSTQVAPQQLLGNIPITKIASINTIPKINTNEINSNATYKDNTYKNIKNSKINTEVLAMQPDIKENMQFRDLSQFNKDVVIAPEFQKLPEQNNDTKSEVKTVQSTKADSKVNVQSNGSPMIDAIPMQISDLGIMLIQGLII